MTMEAYLTQLDKAVNDILSKYDGKPLPKPLLKGK